MRRILIVALIVAAITGSALPATAAPATQLRVAVAGDSTTASGASWRAQISDPTIRFVGGYAAGGTTSSQVLKRLKPVPTAHLLVIRVGTNDIKAGVSQATIVSNIRKIAAKVKAKRVLLSAIAPNDLIEVGETATIDRQARGVALNASLARLATKQGWHFIDPDVDIRTAEGGFIEGYSSDGIHPTREGYASEATHFLTKMLAIRDRVFKIRR